MSVPADSPIGTKVYGGMDQYRDCAWNNSLFSWHFDW